MMRLLLVEPSRIGRSIFTSMLEGNGYELTSCDSVEIALEKLASSKFDVVLTSLEFPTLSGFELCWQARATASQKDPLYIIVISSSCDAGKLAEILDCGADDLMYKPLEKNELFARLRVASRLLTTQRELVHIALYDSLTGLYNRRHFFELMEEMQSKKDAKKNGNYSVLIADIDYFKQVNDRYGHDVGDKVLLEIANRMKNLDNDFARLGGEEFGLIIEGGANVAMAVGNALCNIVRDVPVSTDAGLLHITVSVGISQKKDDLTFEQALREADIALYASKTNGRNRVTIFEGTQYKQ